MQQKKQHKRGYAAIVGGLFMILAIIGIITLIVLSMRLTSGLLDNQRQKGELEHLLQPVVMFDPVPFSSPKDIDNQRLLLYSMWGVLSDSSTKNYKRAENESLLVPASDLDAAAHKLFGKDVTLKHETFNDNQSPYFYDEPNNTYQVQTYGFLQVYRPEILSIKKVDGKYNIRVHYIPPYNAWESVFAGTDTESLSTKAMIYIVDKVDGGWNLLAIEDVPREGAIDQHIDPNQVVPPVREAPEVTTENPFPSDEPQEPVAQKIPPTPAPKEDEMEKDDDDEEDNPDSDSDSLSLLDTKDKDEKDENEGIEVVSVEDDETKTNDDEPVAGSRDSE